MNLNNCLYIFFSILFGFIIYVINIKYLIDNSKNTTQKIKINNHKPINNPIYIPTNNNSKNEYKENNNCSYFHTKNLFITSSIDINIYEYINYVMMNKKNDILSEIYYCNYYDIINGYKDEFLYDLIDLTSISNKFFQIHKYPFLYKNKYFESSEYLFTPHHEDYFENFSLYLINNDIFNNLTEYDLLYSIEDTNLIIYDTYRKQNETINKFDSNIKFMNVNTYLYDYYENKNKYTNLFIFHFYIKHLNIKNIILVLTYK